MPGRLVGATVDLDGRMLPGVEPDQFIAEVRRVIGQEPELAILNVGPRLPEPPEATCPGCGRRVR